MANGELLSSCLGKMSLYIIDLRMKVNSVYYCKRILSQTISEMIALLGGDLLFQQDGVGLWRYLNENISPHPITAAREMASKQS